ncbi:MAG: hypothetical protein NZ585_02375 [Chloracidobacterium sp.]|nr:hypothetical protein [Chloracidobacterium sp.]MDW8218714.1 hypothetical protein [Acidobacteriota bacterium]
MLTPEQQAQYNALLLKQYKGTLTDEERAFMEQLQLLRDAPASSAEVANLSPGLARMLGELDRLDTDLGEMAGKVGGRYARAEAMIELGRHDADKDKKDNA